jgi:hypothetical protein
VRFLGLGAMRRDVLKIDERDYAGVEVIDELQLLGLPTQDAIPERRCVNDYKFDE